MRPVLLAALLAALPLPAAAQTISYVAGGVGGAAAIAAAYFWIAGEDPDRYSRFADAARIDVAPLPGGALASVSVGS